MVDSLRGEISALRNPSPKDLEPLKAARDVASRKTDKAHHLEPAMAEAADRVERLEKELAEAKYAPCGGVVMVHIIFGCWQCMLMLSVS